MIDKQIKEQFGSWTAFCAKYGHDHKNFKRKLLANIDKLNSWLEPLGIELQIVLKKQKEESKMNPNKDYSAELEEMLKPKLTKLSRRDRRKHKNKRIKNKRLRADQ